MYYSGRSVIIGSVLMQVVATVSIGLRLWSRRLLRTRLITSDWLLVMAFIMTLALCPLEIYGVLYYERTYPAGSTESKPELSDVPLWATRRIELTSMMTGFVAVSFVKLSVTSLYYHIFETPKFRWVTRIWFACITVWFLVVFIATICDNGFLNGPAYQISDAITDFVTLLLPFPMIWKLKTSANRKILLAMTFLVGLFSCTASVAKAYIYITGGAEPLLNAVALLNMFNLWNLLEAQVGVVASSALCMRPALRRILPVKALASTIDSLRNGFSFKSQGSAESNWTEKSTSRRSVAADLRVMRDEKTLLSDSTVDSFHYGNYDIESAQSEAGVSSNNAYGKNQGIMETREVEVSRDALIRPEAAHLG